MASRIAAEYARLGCDLGWRFLYSPKATLGPETDIAFFGINPGGNAFETPVASVEQGNAYRTESWPGNGASLQRDVKKLFQLLAVELGRSGDWEAIMDATLTSNFCPFRSPSWAALAKRDDAVRFSVDLWGQLWGSLRPRVVICNGSGTLALMVPVLEHAGYTMAAVESLPSGWGHYSFAVKSYLHETRGGMLVVELPHLSRFRVMTSPGCRDAVLVLVAKLAGALAASRPRSPVERPAARHVAGPHPGGRAGRSACRKANI